MKKINNKNKTKTRLESKSRTRGLLLLVGIMVIAAIALYGPQLNSKSIPEVINYSSFEGEIIPDSIICMVRGDIKSKGSLPIQIEGRTYYGCCEKCLTKLEQNIDNIQYAVDPVSGQTFSKADAIVRQDPQDHKRVLFFKSDETYDQYMKLINKK
jgi:YHS domain-containing protein